MLQITGSSINRRMTLTVVLTTGLSLFLACASFLIYDIVTMRDAIVRQAGSLAEVVGINSAFALAFDDPLAANETLAALGAVKAVRMAVIYDARGREFASYVAPSKSGKAPRIPRIQRPGKKFYANHIDLFQTIQGGDASVGSIFISWDTKELVTKIQWFVAIVLALLAAMAGVSVLLATRLQRDIAEPLEELARATEAIADGDLSTQVATDGVAEIGVLARTFNAMAVALRGLVTQVHHSTSDVSAVSRQLEQAAGSMSREVLQQRNAIDETTSSIEQVTASISEVNTNVEKLAGTAQETSTSIIEMDASMTEVGTHMDRLGDSIDTTSSSVGQVAVNTDQVVKAVESLAIATEGTVSHLLELTLSVKQVKTNAEESHTLSEDSSQEAAKGMVAMEETMEAMHEISTSFGQLQGSVSQLAEKSQSIDEIIQVIGDVAEQTSLLSLNAAIIAAQAGEQGKAFSVVAGEVSSLADRTHRSTQEIANLIRAVQGETASAVAAVNEGSERVERGVQRSNIAGEILSQILEKTQNSTERVHEIVTATTHQSGDLERVDHAINEVKDLVESINHSTRDQQRATAAIAAAIETIRSLGLGVLRSTDEQRQGTRLIMNAMTHVNEMIDQIAEATHSQTTSSEVIHHALSIFRNISEETSRRSEGLNSMVTTLSERSQQLEIEIGRFKTE